MSEPVLPALIPRSARPTRCRCGPRGVLPERLRPRRRPRPRQARREIRGWLSGAPVSFEYTRTLIDVSTTGPDTWLVTNHLEGNFPGGEVDLRYQFQLQGDRIAKLVIEP